MALPQAFLEELRARTPLPPLIGRRVQLVRAGRQWKGCCPFHGEKTPSLHIWDDHYHCFGCGAHGDAISFVMQSESASFSEAVERLAAEAGMEVPKLSPAVAEIERRRHTTGAVLEMAAASFQRRLFLPEGRHALDYLVGRGLTEATIRRFGLGWSGRGRGALAAEMNRDGVDQRLLVDAGLMRADEETGRLQDSFYERVMFPIRDRRSQVISFGGRTLGDRQPKYVNGPETFMFAKRRSLYAHDLAREAHGKAEIVVVEGYMDVIALHQAGFAGAVAPLGTALTAEQLGELWRLSPAPVLCFDGDKAGAKATERAIMTALPCLGPDRDLRIISLPANEDPDSLVRRKGPHHFAALLGAPRALSDATYKILRSDAAVKSVAGRANLSRKLEDAANLVPERNFRWEFLRALRREFRTEFKRIEETKDRHGLATAADDLLQLEQSSAAERARILTAVVLRHPALLRDVADAFAGIELPPRYGRLRTALSAWADNADVLDSGGLMDHLTSSGLAAEAAQTLAAEPVPLPGFALPDAMPSEAHAGWWHIFAMMHRSRLEAEVAAASRDFQARMDLPSQRRLTALLEVLMAVQRGEHGDADA